MKLKNIGRLYAVTMKILSYGSGKIEFLKYEKCRVVFGFLCEGENRSILVDIRYKNVPNHLVKIDHSLFFPYSPILFATYKRSFVYEG